MFKAIQGSLLTKRPAPLFKVLFQLQSTLATSTPTSPPLPLPCLIKPPILEKPCQLNPIIDPVLFKQLIFPSISEVTINGGVEKVDPLNVVKHECLNKLKRIKRPREVFSMTLLHIRHRKMKKHQYKKFIKKYLSLIKKVRMKRNIKKEKAFRVEILAKIKEAEDFDPEKYIEHVLSTIENAPRPMTPKERLEYALDQIRLHRSENRMVRPKFADPVPPHDISSDKQ